MAEGLTARLPLPSVATPAGAPERPAHRAPTTGWQRALATGQPEEAAAVLLDRVARRGAAGDRGALVSLAVEAQTLLATTRLHRGLRAALELTLYAIRGEPLDVALLTELASYARRVAADVPQGEQGAAP
jgi:hypothetical protein